ncbi:hypothetical protein Y032_0002g996 [Ancylostoma ceylanicum]|nr:hypothetical protein Y032_0002g996 [Ancylostoma ceylanicum]
MSCIGTVFSSPSTLITVQYDRSPSIVIRRVETLAASFPSCCHLPSIAAQAFLLIAAVAEEWQQLGRVWQQLGRDATRVSTRRITLFGMRS